jgi:4'-phosphopantetheinyl transferase
MSPANPEPGIDRDTLSVWLASPSEAFAEDASEGYSAVISDDERTRLASLRFPQDRREYLVAHVLARKALSHYHPIPPEAWRFRHNSYGKPSIDPECGLHFNIAHSSNLTVCLISQRGEVGVDVEPHGRGDEILEIASTVCSLAELAQIESLDKSQRADYTLTLWTLKEAYVKAQGKGFSLPLKTISFLRDAAAGFRMHVQTSEKNPRSDCRFCLIDHKGHRIAIVSEAKGNPKAELWELASPMDPPKQLAGARPVFYPRVQAPA